MQLAVLLLLLLSGAGRQDDVRPLLEEAVGPEGAGMLESVCSIAQALAGPKQSPDCAAEDESGGGGSFFPLAPVSNIADEPITYCLVRHISAGQ